MENTHGCILPHLFPSRPGMVFPLFHVLADATELAEAAVLRCESADPLRFDALALQTPTSARLMLANMTAESQTVTVANWFQNEVRVRTLDETTFDYATSDRSRSEATAQSIPLPAPAHPLPEALRLCPHRRLSC